MKTKNTLLLIILLVTKITLAQTSDMGFSFQGYAIDSEGKALANKNVMVRFSITPGTFSEEHIVFTDAYGVFYAIVGNSSPEKKKEFSKLDFTKKNTIYSLKVEVKSASGGAYKTISDEPMKAVPYARYAFNGVPVGTVVRYLGDENQIPEGWLLCDGRRLSRTDYHQLSEVIESNYGGDSEHFNLPTFQQNGNNKFIIKY